MVLNRENKGRTTTNHIYGIFTRRSRNMRLPYHGRLKCRQSLRQCRSSRTSDAPNALSHQRLHSKRVPSLSSLTPITSLIRSLHYRQSIKVHLSLSPQSCSRYPDLRPYPTINEAFGFSSLALSHSPSSIHHHIACCEWDIVHLSVSVSPVVYNISAKLSFYAKLEVRGSRGTMLTDSP